MTNLFQRRRRLLITVLLAALAGWLAPASRAQYAPPANNRVDLNFNYGWTFHKGDAPGAQAVGFDDSKWDAVSLPHTWNDLDRYREWVSSNAEDTVHQAPGDYPNPLWGQDPPKDPVLGTSGAYYGIGWYRKKFTLDPAYAGRRVIAEFSGIGRCAHFYVNGKDLVYVNGTGGAANTIQLPAITGINGDTTLPAQTLNCGYHENGIGPCGVDITNYLNPAGQENLIAVWVTNEFNYNTQEYGTTLPYGQPFNLNFGGLQRDAVLHVSDPLRQTLPLYRNLGTEGVYVYPSNVDTLHQTADLTVQAEVKNDYAADKTATLDAVVVDAAGNQVGSTFSATAATVKAGNVLKFTAKTSMTGVHLWSTDYPYLYQVYTILKVGGQVVDVCKTPLGVRKWKFGSTIGLELNGHPIYLKGYAPRTTMEWPAVGIPPDWMVEYDFNLLKQSGGNFIRPMHSAPRKIQVDTADKYGVVMVVPATATEDDETDPAKWVQKVADMRDVCIYFRNNPSVYFWEGNNGDLSASHMQNMLDVTAQFDPGNVNITPGRDYRDNTRLTGTRSAGTGAAAHDLQQFASPIESNLRDADRPIWDAEEARGECPRHVWDNYTPMLNPFWDGKNADPTPVQGSVATFGDTTHKYIIGGYGYISNSYYERTAGNNPYYSTVPTGGSGINWDAGAGINDYLAVIPNRDKDGNLTGTVSNGYYRLMNSEELMLENTAKYYGRYENSWFVQPTTTSKDNGVTVGTCKIIWADSVTDGRMKIVDVARVSGAVDGARLPKETFYGMRVAQNTVPDIYIMGHWNYPAGTKKTVYVASNTSQVKLQTYDPNGNLIKDYGFGSSSFFPAGVLSPNSDQVNRYVFAFDNVAFQSGYIQAQGYNDGSATPVIQTSLTDPQHPSLKTVREPASIRLTPITGPKGWQADGSDVVMFDAEVVDIDGNRCPTFEDKVTFTASAPTTGTFLGGYNTGIRYSTNITKATTYPLVIESGINRVFARSLNKPTTFTLSVAGSYINAAGQPVALTSNVASVTSTAVPVTNGLASAPPQTYTVALGTEPAPQQEGVAPLPTPNTPQPAPTTNVQGLAYSGTNQNKALLVQNVQPGQKAYVDSSTITLPATLPGYLIGGEMIQPFNSDSNGAPATDQYQFNVSRYSYLYLMLDAANGMPNHDNNASYQWAKQAETVMLNGRKMNVYKSVLQAPFTPVFLATNNYQNASPGFNGGNMYLVFIVSAEDQLQAPSPTDTITASTTQSAAYDATKAIDGDPSTHWNASSGTYPQTIKLTLPKPVNIGGYDITWQNNAGTYFQYTVSVSATDAAGSYVKSLDMSANITKGDHEYRVPAPLVQNSMGVQYVLITINNSSGGSWGAIAEIKVNGVLASTTDTTPPVITSATTLSGNGGYAITPYTIKATGNPTGYAAQGLPDGLTVDGLTGVISGTTLQGGTFPVTITAINGAGAGSAVLTLTMANPPPVPIIKSATTWPPAGATIPAGVAITTANTYIISGDNMGYTGSKYMATLPNNLGLAYNQTSGKITGTPKYPGTYTIPVWGVNPGGAGPVVNVSYTVTANGTPPTITSPATASAYLGTTYTQTSGFYTIKGDGTPTLFGVSAPSGGTLPSWLKIVTSSGVLYGTPDALGDFPIVVSASNAGGTKTAPVTLSVVRNPDAPVITSPLTASGHINSPFTYTIEATKNPTSYTAAGLPGTLQLNGNVISGTPTAQVADLAVTLKAINASGYDQQTLVLNIGPAVSKPVLSGPVNAAGCVGSPFTCQYTATNSPTSYRFAAASPSTSLPAWLRLDPVNGLLSGTPDAVGTTTVSVTAVNDGGTSNTVTLNIAISAAGADINLALNKEVQTSSPFINGNNKTYAVDGAVGTRWESPWDDKEWIYVNLGAAYTIDEVDLNWQGTAVGKNYTIEVSNTGADGSWTNFVAPITGNTKNGVLTYPGHATAQYVRMNGTLRASGYGYSLAEFQVMGKLPTTTAPAGLTTTSGAGAGQITVNWNAVTGAQSYTLQRGTSANGSFVTIATVNAPATTYTDSDPSLSAGVTYYYRVAVTTAQGTSLPSAAVGGTPLVPAGIAGWRYRYFGSAGLNPTDANGASDAANPAHDGISNLLKYALGLDPTANYYASGAAGLPVVQTQTVNGSQYLTLTFTGAATDVTYTVQATGTLDGAWTTLATFSGPSAVGTFTVRDSQAVSAANRRFLRLQVTAP